MSHFHVNPLQLCPNQITGLETVLLSYMHCWRQSVVQTSRDETLVLCFPAKPPFFGEMANAEGDVFPTFPIQQILLLQGKPE